LAQALCVANHSYGVFEIINNGSNVSMPCALCSREWPTGRYHCTYHEIIQKEYFHPYCNLCARIFLVNTGQPYKFICLDCIRQAKSARLRRLKAVVRHNYEQHLGQCWDQHLNSDLQYLVMKYLCDRRVP